jgi:hypothetical protein
MKISMYDQKNYTLSLTVKDTEFSYSNFSNNYTFMVYIVFEKTPVDTTVADAIGDILVNSSEGSNSASTSSSSSNSDTALTTDGQENSTETSVQGDYSDSEEIEKQL